MFLSIGILFHYLLLFQVSYVNSVTPIPDVLESTAAASILCAVRSTFISRFHLLILFFIRVLPFTVLLSIARLARGTGLYFLVLEEA